LKHFGAWNTTKSLQPGQLSLFCVACPHPGINLKPDWKSDPETSDYRCKYTASVVLDGNYSAQHPSSATSAQREVRLGHGTGYFVPEARYLVHLQHAVETKATRVKCVNHCAISQAESERKGCDILGVVSTACGDYGVWFPLDTVNLQKVEKYIYNYWIIFPSHTSIQRNECGLRTV
ncbi:hypothetical protein OF83DRAFT_1072675, partial [Amylostereum chailletii]